MAEQLDSWLELAGSGEVHAVVQVDAGPDVVAARILNLILDAIVRKNGLMPQGETEHGSETLRRVGEALTGRSAHSLFGSVPRKNMLEAAQERNQRPCDSAEAHHAQRPVPQFAPHQT